MDLLVLGGTQFVGRALVLEALARGWSVTALNRGLTGTLPSSVQQIIVDRTTPALAPALEGRSFDLAVDTWASAPSVVQSAASVLKGRVGRFGYVSSLSVYGEVRPPGGDESWPVVEGSASAEATDYAADKRGGELAALEAFPSALLARAGLILGPWENVGRLPWWLTRMAEGGRVVAPGRPDAPMQLIDVRDLAAFVLDALATGLTGPYDLTSPRGHVTVGSFLEAVRDVTDAGAELVWIDQETVLASGAEPWTELPGWVPENEEFHGFMEGDTSRAVEAGLASRPVLDTVRDTWEWVQSAGMPAPRPGRPSHGLPAEIEAALLG